MLIWPKEDPSKLDPAERFGYQGDGIQDPVQEAGGAAGGYLLLRGPTLEVQLRHHR